MSTMTSAEIRQSFLDYFQGQGHRVVSSSPLVPHDDPTLLFTNAGMNQFKGAFLGTERREYRRAATSQKCMRVSGKHNDLENVGPSLRHHTFFEMLGNFSFGDYFKADAIPLAWQLLTDVWGLPADRLHATVFQGEDGIPRDEDARAIWERLVPADRITELGAAENFWAMGDTGPCGRCSEIHYHRGDHLPCGEPTCRGLDCSCDRYVEIWNNVFMEFERQADGTLSPLPAPSIDTGMGLERIVAVLQDKLSNYDTDLFTPLLAAIGERAGTPYGPLAGRASNDASDVSLRVIADHLRAMTFLIGDGVVPSNEWRGYVLRKIMRRAMRHGKKLGLTEPFLHDLVEVVVERMAPAYPELVANRDAIVSVVRQEETQFDKVLTDGLPRLEAALAEAEGASRRLGGDEAFRLWDTFGVPFDFVEDLAGSRGVAVDRDGFDRAMTDQRARARAGSHFGQAPVDGAGPGGWPSTAVDVPHVPDRFVGYETTTTRSTATGLCRLERRAAASGDGAGESRFVGVHSLQEGEEGFVLLDPTPFYLEAGGQVSDTGQLTGEGLAVEVRDVARPLPTTGRMHVVTVRKGALHAGDAVTAEVDAARRDDIRRNHTATHLLHAALRAVVGPHVRQAGSLVAPDRLRFDITHGESVTGAERAEIERLVNARVFENQAVTTEEQETEKAIRNGAMALFGERYGDSVRVVTVPGFSVELCGGTHCRATGDIGPFLITQEGGVAAGVRRIEAVTGPAAVRLLQERGARLSGLLQALGTTAAEALPAVQKLQAEAKRLGREVEQLRIRAAMGGGPAGSADGSTVEFDGVTVVGRRVSNLEKGALRTLADSLRDRIPSGVVVVAAENDGKVSLVVSVTRDLTDRVHAGRVVKAIAPVVGGTGGGRPDFAQAGGRRPDRIAEVFPECQAVVRRMLGGPAADAGAGRGAADTGAPAP